MALWLPSSGAHPLFIEGASGSLELSSDGAIGLLGRNSRLGTIGLLGGATGDAGAVAGVGANVVVGTGGAAAEDVGGAAAEDVGGATAEDARGAAAEDPTWADPSSLL
jgi:hypothetical protein